MYAPDGWSCCFLYYACFTHFYMQRIVPKPIGSSLFAKQTFFFIFFFTFYCCLATILLCVLCMDVKCPFTDTYYHLYKQSQRAHGVGMASHRRRCNVITSHRRWCDVVLTLCAHWDVSWVYRHIFSYHMTCQYCTFFASIAGKGFNKHVAFIPIPLMCRCM